MFGKQTLLIQQINTLTGFRDIMISVDKVDTCILHFNKNRSKNNWLTASQKKTYILCGYYNPLYL